jgi:hypothetical protein
MLAKRKKRIAGAMSRKETFDNAIIENFFGLN